MAANSRSIYAQAELDVKKFQEAAGELKSSADMITGALQGVGTAVDGANNNAVDFSKVLDKSLAKAASKASDALGKLAVNAMGLDAASGAGAVVAEGLSVGLNELVSAFGTTALGITAVTAAVGYGVYSLIDYASGAKAAREALKELNATAETWKNTQAATIYDTGTADSLSRFGLSKADFSQAGEAWLMQLQRTWTDGKKETDEIVKQIVDSFVEVSDDVRGQIESRGALLEGLGILDDAARAQMEQDMAKLEAYDEEVADLLKKNRNGTLSGEDQQRLEEVIRLRADMQLEYGGDGRSPFDRVVEGMQSELDRTASMGANADISIYGDTLNALAQGRQAYIDSLNQSYDAQHAQIMAIEDETQREAALTALNAQYNQQRLQGEQAYKDAVQEAGAQAWEVHDFGEQVKQIDNLAELLSSGMLQDSQIVSNWANSVDEGKLASMIALVEQLRASGMSDSQLAELGIDAEDLYAKLTQIRDLTAGMDSEGGQALHEMFANALPEEIQRILIGLDMTEAAANWEAFMEGKNPFEVTGGVVFEGDDVPVNIRLNPLDQAAISAWEAANADVELTGPMVKVGVGLGADWQADLQTALDGGLLEVYDQNGIPINITPKVLEQITKNDLVAMDADGTVHVVITTKLGSQEAADAALETIEAEPSGISGWFSSSTIERIDVVADGLAEIKQLQEKIASMELSGEMYDERDVSIDELKKRLSELKSVQKDNLANLSEVDYQNIASGIMALGTALASGTLDEATAAQYQEQLEQMLAVVEAAERFPETGSNVCAGIAEGMRSYGWDSDASTLADTIQSAIDGSLGVASPATTMIPTGEYVSAGIGEGMKEYSFAEDAAVVQQNILGAFLGLDMDSNTIGSQFSLNYAAGITLGSGLAAASASDMAHSALNAAKSGAVGATTVGRMISSGVASGIRQGQSMVVSAAADMVRAAINAANATAQIHSPSKVTAEMGKFWDQGWAVGIEKNARVATYAASDMVGQVMRIMDGGMSSDIEDSVRSAVYVEPPAGAAYGAGRENVPQVRVSGQTIDYDALADAMNQRQMNLYMNSKRMAQVMAAEIARAQNARSRSIALGYGAR